VLHEPDDVRSVGGKVAHLVRVVVLVVQSYIAEVKQTGVQGAQEEPAAVEDRTLRHEKRVVHHDVLVAVERLAPESR
jgi:hypothetical protein